MKFAVFTTGYKGYKFLEGLKKKPSFVVSYNNKERKDGLHYKKIIKWCNKNNITLYSKKEFSKIQDSIEMPDKILVIGWQYLIKQNLEKIIVFHDSYLPERRGFAPTISALIDNSEYLGATCFKPEEFSEGPDCGKIYYRKKKQISYPITLQKAFDEVVKLYLEMTDIILEENKKPKMIDYSNSTFSIWRDTEDSRIDWTSSSREIQQKIFSLGFPYTGATSVYNDEIIHILDAEIVDDINFTSREKHFGKIWKIENNCPHILCGKGMIKIIKALDIEDKEIIFNKIRKRLK